MTFKEILRTGIIQLAFLLIGILAFAQEDDDVPASKKERIEQLKIAFITKELDLSSDQAEKFWPVYNEMADKMKVERKNRKKLSEELKNGFETLTDAEIEKKTLSVLDSDVKEAELKKEYTKKIAAIIGYKKATKLLSLEQQFKRELLNKINERQNTPSPANRPRGPRDPGVQR